MQQKIPRPSHSSSRNNMNLTPHMISQANNRLPITYWWQSLDTPPMDSQSFLPNPILSSIDSQSLSPFYIPPCFSSSPHRITKIY